MPPKRGRPLKKKNKDTAKKIATKKEIDEIAEIIGVPPIKHRVLRDKDRSMLKFTQLLKGNPRNKTPKTSPTKKNEELPYFESKIEYHPDKGHRNAKTNKVDLKAQTVATKLNVYGASKRKLIVPKQIINDNEDKQLNEEQSKVKQDKLAAKIMSEMNDPTSLYHNTSFREMVYLKETLNDMSDSEFDCILNSNSPVWWEQDINGNEEMDDPPPEYTSESDEPPLELDYEPSCSISEDMERLKKTETEETIKKKVSLSNLLNNIKQKSQPTSNIEQNLSGITGIEKELDLVNESDTIIDNSKPEPINSTSGVAEITTNENEENAANSPVESNNDENEFIPTVITVIDDLKLQIDQTEDSNPSNDSFLASGKDSHAIDPDQLTVSVVDENNVIEKLCDKAVEEKEIIEELCKEEEGKEEKELNFLSDICKLKRKHDESYRKENEVTQSKKSCAMTYDFSKSKPMTLIDSDEECPKFIVSNRAIIKQEPNKDDLKKTYDKIDSKKEEESKRKQLLKDIEIKKARENQNVILKHKKYKQHKGEPVSFGSKDVIIEKYASKLNEQLSKKSRNVTFSASNDVRYIQPLHEINKEDIDIEKIDK